MPAADTSASIGQLHFTILIPVFNDWIVAQSLLAQIESTMSEHGLRPRIVLINDGSSLPVPDDFPALTPVFIQDIRLLHLRKNLGHQRALCVGLVYLYQSGVEDAVLIMDADGEDPPRDIPKLLREFVRQGRRKIVFAERAKRAEGLIFKTFYQIYRILHRLLVGFDIRVGNFSIVPLELIEQLVVASELWNHYAAAAIKSRLPLATLPLDREQRLSGKSTMGFVGLIVHGLSAMSVYGDTIGVRLLITCAVVMALAVAGLIVAIVVRLTTHLPLTGWVAYASGFLVLSLFQVLILCLIFTFVILYGRGQSNFVPIRDCPVYIGKVATLVGMGVRVPSAPQF